jgi:Tfp pilus assembly protein PilP
MKLTTGILAAGLMTGGLWAQNPNVINNVQSTMKTVQQTKTNDSNAALGTTAPTPAQIPAQTAAKPAAKPGAGAPAPSVKAAAIPGTERAKAPTPKVAGVTASASSQNNTLERVNVVHKSDDVQIEISLREAATPMVSKLSSPARVVLELPATSVATAQSKIPVGIAGIKGVRIGMDGKTPPTTSVVVDLERALAYDVAPGPGNKLILTLHTVGQSAVNSAPVAVPAKASAQAPKVQTASAKLVKAPQAPTAAKVSVPSAKVGAPKLPAKPAAPATTKTATTKIAASEKLTVASKPAEASKAPKPEEKKWAMSGKRDPFFSPVVQQPSGSGCSTGKKCLEIGQINLRGVVKSEGGFIAVVTNSLNKAYFLRENDPVFNGYVVRITGDAVVFQETVQDKLGKPLTREVTKRIFTPAV